MAHIVELTIRVKVEVEVAEAAAAIGNVAVTAATAQPLPRDQQMEQAKNKEARRIVIALLQGSLGHRANTHLIWQHLEKDYGMSFPLNERMQFLHDMQNEGIVRIQDGRLDVSPPTPAIVELAAELR